MNRTAQLTRVVLLWHIAGLLINLVLSFTRLPEITAPVQWSTNSQQQTSFTSSHTVPSGFLNGFAFSLRSCARQGKRFLLGFKFDRPHQPTSTRRRRKTNASPMTVQIRAPAPRDPTKTARFVVLASATLLLHPCNSRWLGGCKLESSVY